MSHLNLRNRSILNFLMFHYFLKIHLNLTFLNYLMFHLYLQILNYR
jgi:hypothetical protein